MKNPDVLTVSEALARLDGFDDILDARSPAEFSLDHVPGAINAPVLDDDERVRVGTLYKQVSSFEAKRIGAALVARNIAHLLESLLADRPREWSPLIYCWRGGNRSGALATILARVGWRVTLLDGGYKAFRNQVISDLESLPRPLRFFVLAGRTGTGKSRLLQTLANRGAQVLDLESIARHRGSLLGRVPGEVQPGQRQFETQLWHQLRRFDPTRPVFVESESRRIGTCHLPEALMHSIRSAECVILQAELPARIRLLIGEYQHYLLQPDSLDHQLERLISLHGRETIERWRSLTRSGNWEALVGSLLEQHYDPTYDRSMDRNFSRLAAAKAFTLDPTIPSQLDAVADSLLNG